LPNDETLQAIKDARENKHLKTTSVDELKNDLMQNTH